MSIVRFLAAAGCLQCHIVKPGSIFQDLDYDFWQPHEGHGVRFVHGSVTLENEPSHKQLLAYRREIAYAMKVIESEFV